MTWQIVIDRTTKQVLASGGPVLYPEDETQEVIDVDGPVSLTATPVYWNAATGAVQDSPPDEVSNG